MHKLLALPLLTLLSLSACQNLPNISPVQLNAQSARPPARFNDTALRDYTWARMTAQRWDIGARLAKVEGRFVAEDGTCLGWDFYFTATAKKKALKVSGSFGEEVQNNYFGIGIFDGSWRIDSDAALKAAKEKGLKKFPVYGMELDSFLRWEIRSADGWFRVDARTGTVSVQTQP